jgi:hypothetical protein
MSFGSVIYGDNQFLGVNHYSSEKSSVYQSRFDNPDEIIKCLKYAYSAGVRDFMYTPHRRYNEVFTTIVAENLFPHLEFIACIPYAHYYNDLLAAGGIAKLIPTLLKQIPLGTYFEIIANTPKRGLNAFLQILIDIELSKSKGISLKGLFLQNIFFDMLLASENIGAIKTFDYLCKEKYELTPGYITMNAPRAAEFLTKSVGLKKPWICSNVNKSGFRNHPSQADVESFFSKDHTNNIAMSIFSEGHSPLECIDYVTDLPGVNSVLFGSGSQTNIEANVKKLMAANPNA